MSGAESSVRRILTGGKRTLAAILRVKGEPVRPRKSEPSMSPGVSEGDLRAAFDGIVRHSLRPLAAGLGVLYTVVAVSRGLGLPSVAPMALVAAGTAALLLGLSLALGRWALPGRWAHPVAAGMAGLVLLNSLLPLSLLAEPHQPTALMLLAVGAGCVLLSTPWLVLVLAATAGGWGFVVWGAVPSPGWLHSGVGLGSAGVLAVLVHTLRVRTLRRLERLRAQNERHKRELEAAVSVAQRNEQRYRAVVEEQTELICRFLPDTTLTFVNSAYCRYFGRRSEELLGKSFLSLLPEAERQAVAAHIASLGQCPQGVLREHTVIVGEGQLRWQQWTDRAILDDTGRVIEFQSVGRDITERKQAEEALRHSEEYFRALTEHALDIITILNGDGTVRYVSPSAERVLGYPLADTLGQEGFAFVHPDDVPGLASTFAEALRRPGEAFFRSEFRLRHHDGSWRTFECVGKNLLENPAVAGVVVNSRDITERKRVETALRQAYQELERRVEERTAELAESNALLRQEITERQRAAEALRRSEEHFRLLIENALDIIILLNGDGTVRYQSPSAERVLGYKPEEAIGKSGFDFIHPDDLPQVIHVFNEGLQKPGVMPPVEIRVQHKDGSWHVIEALGNNLLHNPAVEGVIINVRDITERKHIEDELLKAKERAEAANHAKGEFLSTMSHELRTPLSVVLGYTDLLLEGAFGSLSDEQAHPLRRIRSNAEELVDLITAVLDVSRLEAGRLPLEVRAVEVPALLEEIQAETQEIRERSGLDFVWEVEGELPTLYTDPGKLKVVLKNLIGNAVKFTQKGRITVEARGDPRGVEIKVTDTGIGIPPEALELIFEPFRQVEGSLTRSHGGTGLGLHIVKRLLELLGGTVAVESEVGRGSTFRVWVPRESPASTDIPSSAPSSTVADRELRLVH